MMRTMPDIALRPAHVLAEAIRRRDISSRELLEDYLARVERLNGPLNAVVTAGSRRRPAGRGRSGCVVGARRRRRTAARRADDDQGHLPDRGHAHDLRAGGVDHVPEHDAEAVRRLRERGRGDLRQDQHADPGG